MGSIPNDPVVCKCLDGLDLSDERDAVLDYRAQKLTTAKLVKLMIEAQLKQHSSYHVISEHLQSSELFQQELQLSSISGSQVSRKLRVLPYTFPQSLFLKTVEKLNQLTKHHKGIPGLGRLEVIDSTVLTLPEVAGKWAYCSSSQNAVKMHTRLIVADPNTVFPNQMIASTADVADSEVVLELAVDKEAIYVMDRGYIAYRNYKAWVDQQIRFVARIKKQSKTVMLRERTVPATSKLLRDADVKISYAEQGKGVEVELRLVEFTDDKGNFYRVLTNVMDLSAEQISEIYRHRWLIELFFKWVKQHLKLVKLYSVKAEAIWSQMYLALTAYALVLLIKLETGTKRSTWQVMQLLRLYAEHTWQAFLEALFRPPLRASKGRRKKAKIGRPRKHPVKHKGAKMIIR